MWIDMENKLKISRLLGWGFNCTEIASFLDIHPVTVRRIKLNLKKDYLRIYKKEVAD